MTTGKVNTTFFFFPPCWSSSRSGWHKCIHFVVCYRGEETTGGVVRKQNYLFLLHVFPIPFPGSLVCNSFQYILLLCSNHNWTYYGDTYRPYHRCILDVYISMSFRNGGWAHMYTRSQSSPAVTFADLDLWERQPALHSRTVVTFAPCSFAPPEARISFYLILSCVSGPQPFARADPPAAPR